MNKIDFQIAKLKKSGKIGLMTHVVVGYPSLKATEKLIDALVMTGSDFIELQIPFSDPLADGALIMQANEVALKQNIHLNDGLNLMKRVTKKYKIPFLFMGYFNSIFSYGVEKFCQNASEAGAAGAIVPDIPPEEESWEQFIRYCLENNLYPIRVLSPASNSRRLAINIVSAKGFIYVVRGYGVTGSYLKSDSRLDNLIKEIKKTTKLPLAMGFGISSKNQIYALKGVADIAVVGSAIIKLIMKQDCKVNTDDIELFIRQLKEGC